MWVNLKMLNPTGNLSFYFKKFRYIFISEQIYFFNYINLFLDIFYFYKDTNINLLFTHLIFNIYKECDNIRIIFWLSYLYDELWFSGEIFGDDNIIPSFSVNEVKR